MRLLAHCRLELLSLASRFISNLSAFVDSIDQQAILKRLSLSGLGEMLETSIPVLVPPCPTHENIQMHNSLSYHQITLRWRLATNSFSFSFSFADEPAIGVDTAKITESDKKDVQMHIQEEDHGVGWCAKIVFFTLMAILAGLVVLIVLENRGGSDREFIGLSLCEMFWRASLF
jgi:hypothetical protein